MRWPFAAIALAAGLLAGCGAGGSGSTTPALYVSPGELQVQYREQVEGRIAGSGSPAVRRLMVGRVVCTPNGVHRYSCRLPLIDPDDPSRNRTERHEIVTARDGSWRTVD
jgi:hypothetical protein